MAVLGLCNPSGFAAGNYTGKVMTRGTAIFLIIAGLSYPQAKKPSKKPKPADVIILKPVVQLSDGVVTLDGAVRNSGERRIKGLILRIDFLGTNKELLTTWRGPIDSELLEPEQETEFHMQVKAPLHAILVRFNGADAEGRDLRLENAGPHDIN